MIIRGDFTNIRFHQTDRARKIIDGLAGIADFDRRIEQADEENQQSTKRIDHPKIILAEFAATVIDSARANRNVALVSRVETQKKK